MLPPPPPLAATLDASAAVPPPLDLPPMPIPPPAPAVSHEERGPPPAPPSQSSLIGFATSGGEGFDPLADELFESQPPVPVPAFLVSPAPHHASAPPVPHAQSPSFGRSVVSTPPEALLAVLQGAPLGTPPPPDRSVADPFAALPERPEVPPVEASDPALAVFDDLFQTPDAHTPPPATSADEPLSPRVTPAGELTTFAKNYGPSRTSAASASPLADAGTAPAATAARPVTVRFIPPAETAATNRGAPDPRGAPSALASLGAWAAVGVGAVFAATGLTLAAWTYGAPLDAALQPLVERTLGVRPPYSALGLDDDTLPALEQAANNARQASDLALEVSVWRRVLQSDANHADALGRLHKIMALLGERRPLDELSSP